MPLTMPHWPNILTMFPVSCSQHVCKSKCFWFFVFFKASNCIFHLAVGTDFTALILAINGNRMFNNIVGLLLNTSKALSKHSVTGHITIKLGRCYLVDSLLSAYGVLSKHKGKERLEKQAIPTTLLWMVIHIIMSLCPP